MRTAALVCNFVLFAIAAVIVLTEGVPGEAHFLVLTLLVLLVPLCSAFVLLRRGGMPQGSGAAAGGAPMMALTLQVAVLCNAALLVAAIWAAVGQYPYPEGNSIIPFAAFTVFTPFLSLLALLRGGRSTVRGERRNTPAGHHPSPAPGSPR